MIQYRFSNACTLFAQEVVLHHAVMSRRNVKLLQQQGAQGEPNYTYWASEKSSKLFAGFFTPQASLSEGGKQLTRYLDEHDKQTIACLNRSAYTFFKQVSFANANAEQLYQQAMAYRDGKAGIQDDPQAARYFYLAAEKGHVEAQFHLGVCYDTGCGVAKDPQKAVAYYQKAAQAGHASAQHNLGMCYQQGLGIPQDISKAADYYRQASAQGHLAAKDNWQKLMNAHPELIHSQIDIVAEEKQYAVVK